VEVTEKLPNGFVCKHLVVSLVALAAAIFRTCHPWRSIRGKADMGRNRPISSALERYFPEKDDLRPVYGGLILG
jgi:hypothetical protein